MSIQKHTPSNRRRVIRTSARNNVGSQMNLEDCVAAAREAVWPTDARPDKFYLKCRL